MTCFLDTSALVKYFHLEKGSDAVDEILSNAQTDAWISELAIVEFYSAFCRRMRMNEINAEMMMAVDVAFKENLPRFKLEPIGIPVINAAVRLLTRHAITHSLKTLDSIQLATYETISNPGWIFVTADRTLSAVAEMEKYSVLLIES